jgi:hypothetical protein
VTPESIYGKHSTNVRVSGECWLWSGPTRGKKKKVPYINYIPETQSAVGTVRYGLAKAGVEFEGEQVNPDHAADTHSVVGRMLFVKTHSYQDGDCRIWTGTEDFGYPRMQVGFYEDDERNRRMMYVRTFVWIAEHVPEGSAWPTTGSYIPTCGNQSCVSHKHIERHTGEGDTYDFG